MFEHSYICIFKYTKSDKWIRTFLRLDKFGKPFKLVRPTLMRLNDSRETNSFVKPTICVLRQLSRTSSLICNIEDGNVCVT